MNPRKRFKQLDIREALEKQTRSETTPSPTPHPPPPSPQSPRRDPEEASTPPKYPEEFKHLTWDDKIEEFKLKIEHGEIEKAKRLERAGMELKSWELARICKLFLSEHADGWKKDTKQREKERQEIFERNERIAKGIKKKETLLKKLKQTKLTNLIESLPKKIQNEKIEKENRLELQELKENIWKKWRGKKENSKKVAEKKKMEEKIENIEDLIKTLKCEEDQMRKKKEKEKEEKISQEKIKRERKEKKLAIEKRWEMARWCHEYITKNTPIWEEDAKRRQESREISLAEWEKKKRFEKINYLKNKAKNGGEKTTFEADFRTWQDRTSPTDLSSATTTQPSCVSDPTTTPSSRTSCTSPPPPDLNSAPPPVPPEVIKNIKCLNGAPNTSRQVYIDQGLSSAPTALPQRQHIEDIPARKTTRPKQPKLQNNYFEKRKISESSTSRKFKVSREFQHGQFTLIEVRDYGLAVSSRKEKRQEDLHNHRTFLLQKTFQFTRQKIRLKFQ